MCQGKSRLKRDRFAFALLWFHSLLPVANIFIQLKFYIFNNFFKISKRFNFAPQLTEHHINEAALIVLSKKNNRLRNKILLFWKFPFMNCFCYRRSIFLRLACESLQSLSRDLWALLKNNLSFIVNLINPRLKLT